MMESQIGVNLRGAFETKSNALPGKQSVEGQDINEK